MRRLIRRALPVLLAGVLVTHVTVEDVLAVTCGDGLIEGAETCDDGGTTPGDGCDAACQVEPCSTCNGEPSICRCYLGDTCGLACTQALLCTDAGGSCECEAIIPSTWTDIQASFTIKCAVCHTAGGSFGFLGDLDDYDQGYANIVNTFSVELPSMDRVEPFDPLNSYLMHKLDGTHIEVGGFGVQMPAIPPYLSPAERDGIRAWIQAGAPKN